MKQQDSGKKSRSTSVKKPYLLVEMGTVTNQCFYQTKAGKAHDFNRGMKGRTLELLWEKFQNNFVYIHVFVTTWHLKYDIIDT